MRKTLPYIKNSKRIVLLLVVLFSLSPCTVKESIYKVFDTEYQRPLNKTKSAQTVTDTCLSEIFSNTQAGHLKKIDNFDLFGVVSPTVTLPSAKALDSIRDKETKQSSGLSPPMYILYKRMKIDMA